MRASSVRPFILALGLAIAGCGSGDDLPRQAVGGSVSLGGEPLATGTISFQPADPSGVATPVAAVVKDGVYSVSRADGPVPGDYRVSISSPRPATPKAGRPAPKPDEGVEVPMTEAIPAKYNTKPELKAQVTKGGGNQFDFALDSAK